LFGEAAVRRAAFIPGLSQAAGAHWERENRRRVAALYRVGSHSAGQAGIARGLALGALLAGAAGGLWLVSAAGMTAGEAAAAAVLAAMALAPVVGFQEHASPLRQGRDAWRIVAALPTAAPVLKCATGRTAVPAGALVFDDVGFTYMGRTEPTLAGVSFRCNRGECVAITGAAGSGKSTLAAIAAGAVLPTVGSASIDDIEVARWQRAPDAAPVGYAADDPHLIEGTVRQNIAGFAADEPALAEDAAARAGVAALILSLPHGFDTQVGPSGDRLSRRERRAVALARACYGERAFLVIDEPEGGLDAVLLQAFEEVLLGLLAREAGVILVTRNPALLDLADRVIALDGGTPHEVPRRHRPVRRPALAVSAVLH
jgi:ABC-type protease/lipase transport system fused ATPase/permease subunit